MAKNRKPASVLPSAFDKICCFLGPVRDGGNRRVADILCCGVRTVENYRKGRVRVPESAYELIRLTLAERYRVYEHMTGKYRSVKFLSSSPRLSDSVGLHYGVSANDEMAVIDFGERLPQR